MELGEYQRRSAEYDFACRTQGEVWYYALGMCGEAGEVAEKVKKSYRDGTPLDLAALEKEIGDVLWYVSNFARHLHLSLDHVAEVNIAKLEDRKRRDVERGSGDDR